MRNELRSVYGPENVRTITQEEYERSLVMRRQDKEFEEAVFVEAQQQEPSAPQQEEEPTPPNLEELRALRVKYFTQKAAKSAWKHRLRPRK